MEGVVASREAEGGRSRDRWIGVYIGILAAILAVTAMGGDNAAKTANAKNIQAANTWSFFQAKNLRRQIIRAQIEQLELKLVDLPPNEDSRRLELSDRIAKYKATESKLTTDPESGEGLDELFVKGKALEHERDRAMAQDPFFDYGQALLQIAIVLASIAIIIGGNSMLVASGLVGFGGVLMTLNGFTLWVMIPGL